MNETQQKLKKLTDFTRKNDSSFVKGMTKLLTSPRTRGIVKLEMQKDLEEMKEDHFFSEEKSNRLLINIHQKINKDVLFRESKAIYKIISWYTKVAAILLLPLLTWAIIAQLKPQYNAKTTASIKIFAPMGSRIQSKLPDGSRVWLNSGSSLEYSQPFYRRNVKIMGEAYFEIAKDMSHPFVVTGPNADIIVTGTAFNAIMWPDDNLTEIALSRGSVKMKPHGSKKIFSIKPGELLTYQRHEAVITKKQVNPENYSAWREGKLILRDQNMSEVAKKLARWFNVDVEVQNSKLDQYCFHATFKDEKIEDVLRLLKMTSPINYEIINNHQESDGTFSKKKIIIK
ncbi:FecR family protein [Geofilum sp. OHC36d9]|uniref:FecR family protein n=1 Tax=Geofilum sp. OHC36d9 TaxID=3458413 RepID=UPI00403491C5